jgi:transposase-like protein
VLSNHIVPGMDIHKNARLTLHGREALAKMGTTPGVTLNSAAAEFKVSARTAAKWIRRYQADGRAGLRDHSSRPRRFRRPTPPSLIEQVETLRRQRWTGLPHRAVDRSQSGHGQSDSAAQEAQSFAGFGSSPPLRRYEHACPGDLPHLDISNGAYSSGKWVLQSEVACYHCLPLQTCPGVRPKPKPSSHACPWSLLHSA